MSLEEALRRVLGDDRVGVAAEAGLDVRARPRSGEELAAALRVLGEAKAPAVVRGGGSWDGLGYPMPEARVLLETAGLASELRVDAEDGVAHLPAGARVSSLREHVRKATDGAWELPLDPASPAATLGGCLATAAPGLCFGHPRDVVLGLETALATGERVRCGGRVVKNVTGYDLAKLYLGSLGSLGVIEGAWLRLCPAPQATALRWVPAPDPGAVVECVRRPSVRAAAWLSDGLARELGYGEPGALIELAGDEPAVVADREALGEAAEPAGLGRVRELQGREAGLRVRVAVLPSALSGAARALAAASAQVLAQPSRGLLWALAPDERALDVAAQVGEGYRVESAPLETRRTRALFSESPALRPLQAAVKAQYDPQGLLNPGRFAGRI